MKGNLLALGTVTALVLASRSRGSAARRPPLDYDALADDFREWYATLDWGADEERELRRWARSHGVTYLGAGAQRAVFGVPGGALKIAFDRDGKDANRREAEVWEDAPADIRRHLVPVLANSGMEPGEGDWLLMEQVNASGRGKLPEEAAARLYACGFNDIVGQNISDDGRLLDYGWMYMDKWAPCATPGSYTSNRPTGSATRGPATHAPVPFPWDLGRLLNEQHPFRPTGRRHGWSLTSPEALATDLAGFDLVSIVGSMRANTMAKAWVRAHDAELRGATTAGDLYDLLRRFDAEVVRPAREHLETKGAHARKKQVATRVTRVEARRTAAIASDPGPVTTPALGRAWAKDSAVPGPLYHATRAGPTILAEGLLPRRAVGVREREAGVARPGLGTLGGGPEHVVSFTSDRAAARRIAAALQALNEAQTNPGVVYEWFVAHWLPYLERWNPPVGKHFRHPTWYGPPTAQRVRELMSQVGSYSIGQDPPAAMRVPWIMGTPMPTAPESIGVVTAYAHVDQLYSSGFGNRGRTWGRIVKEWTAGNDGFGNMRVGCPSRRGGPRSTEGQALPLRVAELGHAALAEATLNASEANEIRVCPEDLTVVGFEPVINWRKILTPPRIK